MFEGILWKLLEICFLSIVLQNGIKETCFVLSHNVLDSTNLYNELFSGKYNEKIIPRCENGPKVTMELQTALRQIIDVNEIAQIITVNIWIRMKWNDCRLKWNVTSYGNVSYIHVPIDTVWVPDVTVYDSAAEEEVMPGKGDYYAAIYSDGNVTYKFPTIIKSICRVDVTYFPVDTQRCGIKFGSWSHHGSELDIISVTKEADLSTYLDHQEWTLSGMPAVRYELYYKCCVEPFPDLTYYLELRRKPTFYIMTVFFPGILTSFLTMLTFFLPVESGEKVALGITVLLSLTVFLLLVSESLPASSDSFPLIGIYFVSSMALVSMSCFMTAIVLNYHCRGCTGRKVPDVLRRYIINGLGPILCANAKEDPSDQNADSGVQLSAVSGESQPEINPLSDDIQDSQAGSDSGNSSVNEISLHARVFHVVRRHNTTLKKLMNRVYEVQGNEEAWREWHMLSRVLDRLFFLIYLLSTVITSATFFTILSIH